MSNFEKMVIATLTFLLVFLFAFLIGFGYTKLVSNQAQAAVMVVPTETPTRYPTLELPTAAAVLGETTPTATLVVEEVESSEKSPTMNEEINDYVDKFAPPTTVPTPVVEEPQKQAAGVNVSFSANPTSVNQGQCATLNWVTEGVKAYWVDGQPGAGGSGNRQVCPGNTTTYELKYQMTDANNFVKTHTQLATVSVAGGDTRGNGGGESYSPSDRNQGGSTNTTRPSSGGSVSNVDVSAQKAGVCNSLTSEFKLMQEAGDILGAKYVQDLINMWQCGNSSFTPNMCDIYGLHKNWAEAEGDITKVKKYNEDLIKGGC